MTRLTSQTGRHAMAEFDYLYPGKKSFLCVTYSISGMTYLFAIFLATFGENCLPGCRLHFVMWEKM